MRGLATVLGVVKSLAENDHVGETVADHFDGTQRTCVWALCGRREFEGFYGHGELAVERGNW